MRYQLWQWLEEGDLWPNQLWQWSEEGCFKPVPEVCVCARLLFLSRSMGHALISHLKTCSNVQ